jgi:hypothetical protein
MSDDVKIPEIVDLEKEMSQSQLARLKLQDEVFNNLMLYLQSHIQTLTSTNVLEEEIEQEILNKMREEGGLGINALLRLYEIIKRAKTEQSVGVFSILQKSTNITINPSSSSPINSPPPHQSNNLEDFTKEEMSAARDLLKLFRELENTELNPEEKK